MKTRTQVLIDLVNLARPVEELRSELNEFEWNSKHELYTLTNARIAGVFERALNEEFPIEDLISWADGLEEREDLVYEEGYERDIAQILFLVSTPAINYPITKEFIRKLLNNLNQKSEPDGSGQ